MKNLYFVYMITNVNNTVLYIGVTNNLKRRMYEHKNKIIDGFSKRYNLNKLIYYKETTDIISALEYEKKLKGYNRKRKENLINEINPNWVDLSKDF